MPKISSIKLAKRNNKKGFLLTFFDKEEGYEEKEVNGFWLIKHWNGDSQSWTVDIFSAEGYKNYKSNSLF